MQVGENFTNNYIVTNDTYKTFINLSNDNNVLHTDENFAKSKGFRDKVMHGNILNAFLSHFVGECLPIDNVIIHSQEIKFTKPVYMNDDLLLKAEILDYFESVKAYRFKFSFTNSDEQIVALGKIQIGEI